MRKFGIIGIGHVGVTIAYTLVTKGIADELVLIDTNEGKAVAEQLDLEDAQARLDTTTQIKIQNYADLSDADIVFMTAGKIDAAKESGNRWAEFEYTSASVKNIAPQLKASGFNGIVIDTTNPCDAITQYLQQSTGLSTSQVFGTGTFLDTARMQRVVSEQFDTNSKNVAGYTLGEHGDSQFVAWSSVQVNSHPLEEFAKQQGQVLDYTALEKEIRLGGWSVYQGKGYTSFGIATCAVKLAEAVLSDAKLECPVSCYNEEFDTYIGQSAVIGKNGVEFVNTIPLTDDEKASFKNSAETIKEKFATM
ncbi:L-lactate dehydrogenase [Companilactobacillus allii]|uniref:L-lactate dehydrogenase n=1 Tax=Companilactobacillus allii TaxID=1847728 RepID=A0A1P8Q2W8_9LACO|nr:L-lactate dehydrogenase [Companilactobacillus allii]APX72213.1 L-lactate dehydrogenase [Companilactobacillus allii]USQ69306.1 L-lactate dehydrogenase [Companilactobacillus allii]